VLEGAASPLTDHPVHRGTPSRREFWPC
jgi:hypothetical protein